jgi:uncharacterized protein YceK
MKKHGIVVLALLALAVAGCSHLRSKDASAGANTDEASTVKKSTSTMPEGSRYQTSSNEAK